MEWAQKYGYIDNMTEKRLSDEQIQKIINTPKTSFVDCEYRRDKYCTNPQRYNKNTIALFCCRTNNCKLEALKKWW